MDSLETLDEDLIRKIKGIQLKAKFLVNDVFAGEYQSAFKGRGLEFDEVREYQPGDDVRTIDWNVTARSGRPFVKLFHDERELTVMFLVDVSGSSQFGSDKKLKNEISAEIAALLAYSALKSNDKIGLLIFSDHVEHYIPPKKGRGHVWQLIRDILSYKAKSKKTSFSVPLEFLRRVLKRRAVVFMISDFQGGDYEKSLQTTSRLHDLIAIEIRDSKEEELPNLGYVELEDAETGQTIIINTSNQDVQKEYKSAAELQNSTLHKFFLLSGIDNIEVNTDGDFFDPVVRFLKKRERRLK